MECTIASVSWPILALVRWPIFQADSLFSVVAVVAHALRASVSRNIGSEPGFSGFRSLTESERLSDPILTWLCYNEAHRREALWRNEFFLLFAIGPCESI